MPTPDRERLSDRAADELEKMITGILENHIMSLPDMSLHDYASDPGGRLLDVVATLILPDNSAMDGKLRRHRRYYDLLRAKGRTDADSSSKCAGNHVIDRNFVVTKKIKPATINALRTANPDIVVFKPKNPDDIKNLFVPCGIRTVKQYMKEHGIKEPDSQTERIKVFKCVLDPKKDPYTKRGMDEIGNDVVLASPRQTRRLRGLFGLAGVNKGDILGFTVQYACLNSARRYGKAGTSYERWLEILGNHIYATSRGVMTVRQVAESMERTILFDGNDPGLVGAGDAVFVFEGGVGDHGPIKVYFYLMRVPVLMECNLGDLSMKERRAAAKLGIRGGSHMPVDGDDITVIRAYLEARIPAVRREIKKAYELRAWRKPEIADVAGMMVRLSRSIETGYSPIVEPAEPASRARAHAWACIRYMSECVSSSRLASALYGRFWRSRVQEQKREMERMPDWLRASREDERSG